MTKQENVNEKQGRSEANSFFRRLIRFRLRTLMAVITLISLLLGGYLVLVAPYLRQNEIRLAIKAAGGLYEAKSAPAWLRAVFGSDNVCVLTKVDLARYDGYRGYEFEFRPSYISDGVVCDPSPTILKQIKDLTDLEALNVAGQDVDDSLVAGWDGLVELTSLNLADTLVRDPSRWPQFSLTALDLQGVFITGRNTGVLTRYPDLKSLNLAMTPLTDAGLSRLKPLTTLQDLNLTDTAVTTASFDILKSFPRLDRLGVGPSSLSQFDKEVPFLMTNADTVGDGLTFEVNFAAIEAARDFLQERIERSTPASGRDPFFIDYFEGYHLDLLAGNQTITHLVLSNAYLRLEDIRALQALPNLTALTIFDAKLDDDAWSIIAACPRLDSIDISGGLTDDGLRRLLKCSALRYLGLSGTHVTDEGLAHLAEHPELVGLSLYETPITHKGLRHLQPLQELEWIILPLIHGPGLRDLTKLASLQDVDFLTGSSSPQWRQLPRWTEPTLTAEDIDDFAVVATLLNNRARENKMEWKSNYWRKYAEDLPYPGHEQAELIYLLLPFELSDKAKQRLPDGGLAWETIRSAAMAGSTRW